MDQIASQWPLLAGFLLVAGMLLKVIQGIYERWLADVTKQRDAWMEAALAGTDIAETMTGVVEQTTKRRP